MSSFVQAPKVSLRTTALRWLIFGHRWLGILTCLFFFMWFATGLVLMYVGFPEYTRSERLSRLEPIDWSAIRIPPDAALDALAAMDFPRQFRLEMSAGEPVYRIGASGLARHAISAVTGQPIENVTAAQARTIAERASGATALTVTTIERDQWTVAGTFEGHRPLHRVTLNSPDGLELYVSSRTGEIVLDTTRRERGWNWIGAVLHWLYFTELRANPPLWSQVVMWLSGTGILVAITGLWLGIDRLRIKRRENGISITPFRGWMAWHHVLGLVGGAFVLMWIFSGWLSMGPPVPWERPLDMQRRAAVTRVLLGNPEPTFPADLQALATHAGHDVREVAFMWALGKPQFVLTDANGRRRVLDATNNRPRTFDEREWTKRLQGLMHPAMLESAELLTREDAYWYSRRGSRTLPVLRCKFGDEDRTWIYIDPETGQLVGWIRKSDRIHRWLFNGLHSLDFRWLLAHRPLWDIVMWVLSTIGLALCATSIVIGWRALRR